MIDTLHRSPANVSAQAAAPMPRWALVFLLAAFILPGLFGHDLWPQDAAGFGRMWAMAQGGLADWLFPQIAGALVTQEGPLPYWLGALAVRLGGSLIGDTNAAAATNLLWYPLAMLGLWLGAYRFARRDEAQPVAGAFGGEASRRDYARLVADVCVLLTIGTMGMIWRLHQMLSDGATTATVALAVLATSLFEWHLGYAALLAGLSAGAMALNQGPLVAAGLLAGCLAALWMHVGRGGFKAARAALASALMVASALSLAMAWPLAAYLLYPREAALYFGAWLHALPLGLLRLEDAAWALRSGAWFLWPLWPLAAWAVYAWRGSLQAAHLERPLLVGAGLALALLLGSPPDERLLVALIPPLVILAAFGATALRRALDNLIDWFAMTIISLALVFCWSYFLAMQLGAPKAMAASIARLAPGYAPVLHPVAMVVAALASGAWIYLVYWRVGRRPRVLWRGPMLAGAGTTIVWIAANLLFLPAVDYVLSYRSFAQEVATQLRARGLAQGCVQAHRLPLPERAILAYYGHIRFDREGSAETCLLALHHDSRRSLLDDDPPPGVRGMWELSWEGRRRARPDERWRIWVRAR